MKKNIPKYFLKKILEKNTEISFNRPKMGFGNPIGLFLNNELKEWSINLINNDNDFIEDIINMDQIHKIWELHQNKKRLFKCNMELLNIKELVKT